VLALEDRPDLDTARRASADGRRSTPRDREPSLTILQVSAFDRHGGAERVAWDLFQSYRSLGHASYFAVGRKRSADPDVLLLPNHEASSRWQRFWWGLHRGLQPCYGRFTGSRSLCRLIHRIAEPRGWRDVRRGLEDFHYPGTWRLLDITPRRPDVIHCHNLHQNYFDLRALPWLCRQAPVVLTLHDAWLLAGHCAHSFDCERWKTGCGECPALSLYSPIRRDGSAENWRRKRDIYAAGRLHVATPCHWLRDRVEQSMLAPGVVEARVIPYGVDLDVFRPGDHAAARAALGLPRQARVLLFAASGIRDNVWKDFRTMRAAIARLAESRGLNAEAQTPATAGRPLIFVALGEDAPAERIGRGAAGAEVRFVPFQADPAAVACHYQAADVYVHAARADTFPNAVLEALACGLPVAATAVGGIPEQVIGLDDADENAERATGMLTAPADEAGLAAAVERLLINDPLRLRLSDNAAADAHRRFDLRRQTNEYLAWYKELLVRRRPPQRLHERSCSTTYS